MTGAGEEERFEPEERALCADPACIGLLGEDGRCKVCGRPGEPWAAVLGERAEALQTGPGSPEAEEEPDDFADRRLCADPACIGLLGEDGRCKVCGWAGA